MKVYTLFSELEADRYGYLACGNMEAYISFLYKCRCGFAIHARMLLYAASPLVNGNTDYAGNTNKAGVEIFSQTYDPTRWQNSH